MKIYVKFKHFENPTKTDLIEGFSFQPFKNTPIWSGKPSDLIDGSTWQEEENVQGHIYVVLKDTYVIDELKTEAIGVTTEYFNAIELQNIYCIEANTLTLETISPKEARKKAIKAEIAKLKQELNSL